MSAFTYHRERWIKLRRAWPQHAQMQFTEYGWTRYLAARKTPGWVRYLAAERRVLS